MAGLAQCTLERRGERGLQLTFTSRCCQAGTRNKADWYVGVGYNLPTLQRERETGWRDFVTHTYCVISRQRTSKLVITSVKLVFFSFKFFKFNFNLFVLFSSRRQSPKVQVAFFERIPHVEQGNPYRTFSRSNLPMAAAPKIKRLASSGRKTIREISPLQQTLEASKLARRCRRLCLKASRRLGRQEIDPTCYRDFKRPPSMANCRFVLPLLFPTTNSISWRPRAHHAR